MGVGRKGKDNERLAKLITRKMGVHIPYRLGAQISTQGIVWQGSAKGRRDYPRTVFVPHWPNFILMDFLSISFFQDLQTHQIVPLESSLITLRNMSNCRLQIFRVID